MEFFDKEVVKSINESSNLSRSSICAILQQKCGHQSCSAWRCCLVRVKICLLREVTKKYVADLTSVESQKKLLLVWKWEVTKVYPQQFDFRDKSCGC